MYLLVASLVSGQANANPLLLSTLCGGRPCLGIDIGSNGTILPPDWIELESRELDGNLNFFRVEVTLESGQVAATLGEVTLDERTFAAEESDERTSVYYVPATWDAVLVVTGDRRSIVDFVVEGSEKSPL